MADIFISYTSADRDWAFWIAKELEALGHVVHVDAWEIGPTTFCTCKVSSGFGTVMS